MYFNKEFGRSRTVDTTLPCESHDYISLYMYVVPYVTRVSSRGRQIAPLACPPSLPLFSDEIMLVLRFANY